MAEPIRIEAHGATLAACRSPGGGIPIVLLHGGPGMGDYLEPVASILSPPRHVLRYDQRGCGESTRDCPCRIEDHVEDLDSVRAFLGANRIHLFGHSWGGLLAQLYARAHPRHVASLALCCSAANTGAAFSMEGNGLEERVIGPLRRSGNPGALVSALLMGFPGELGEAGFRGIMKRLFKYYFAHPESAPRSGDLARISKAGWRATNASIRATPESFLAALELDAPVLILQGRQDPIRETNAVLVARLPAAVNTWVEDCGHFPWLEKPGEFREALLSFYAKTDTAA